MEERNVSPFQFGLQLLKRLVFATVICMFVCFSMSFLPEYYGISGYIGMSVLTVGISGGMMYLHAWSVGDHDANAVQFGRMEPFKLKGLFAGLYLVLFVSVLAIPLALSIAGILPIDFLPFYRLLNSPLWGIINLIHPYGAIPHAEVLETETTVYQAATAGMSWGQFIGVILLPLIYVPFTTVGYILGYKRFSIIQKVVYKNEKKEKTKKDPRL